MQSLWSNAAGRCLLTSAPGLMVATPGTQKSTLGASVSVQVRASSNTGTALTYKASGLPAGLSVGSTSGKITGKPAITAGTFSTTITVSDYAGWIRSPSPGRSAPGQGRSRDTTQNAPMTTATAR